MNKSKLFSPLPIRRLPVAFLLNHARRAKQLEGHLSKSIAEQL